MNYLDYPKFQILWSPLDFLSLKPSEESTNKKVEERKKEAKAGIITENDRQESELRAKREEAIKSEEQKANYQRAEQGILSQNRPLTTGPITTTQEFVGYAAPGYSTLMFADDASKDATLVAEAIKNKQWGPAIGHAIKVPADIAMGAVSLIPFAGAAIKGGSKLMQSASKLKNNYTGYKISKIIDNSNPTRTISAPEVPIQKGYMYHTTDGYRPHSIHPYVRGKDGKIMRYGEYTPGSLRENNGKYTSARPQHGDTDLIWWDTKGHNRGNQVYVTKLDDDAINVLQNLEQLDISLYAGRYEPTYYVTKPIEINRTIKFTKDPISGSYIPSVPRKITTNKMTIPELFSAQDPLNNGNNVKTSLAFF